MNHRHLSPSSLSLAVIDDVICRGGWQDWMDLRKRVLASGDELERLQRLCRPHLANGYAQRCHFWVNYAQAHVPAQHPKVSAMPEGDLVLSAVVGRVSPRA